MAMTISGGDRLDRPALEQSWRSIVLYGRNVASYKFALAKALLDLGKPGESLVSLEDLAVPFAREITSHLKTVDRQATSASSRFLDCCRKFNAGQTSAEELKSKTVSLGFNNVVDAFHVVDRSDVPVRYFVDERRVAGGIRLTDAFYRLQEGDQAGNLKQEAEARWNLVETAWELGLAPALLRVDYDRNEHRFYVDASDRRRDVTSARSALDGYQRGRCFYCFASISVVPGDLMLADVDHFLPWMLMSRRGFPWNLDGLWNLVLSCQTCNRGPAGKFEQLPEEGLIERLHRRNEWLIRSHKPLRETLFNLAGPREEQRRDFLRKMYREASALGNLGAWVPEQRAAPAF